MSTEARLEIQHGDGGMGGIFVVRRGNNLGRRSLLGLQRQICVNRNTGVKYLAAHQWQHHNQQKIKPSNIKHLQCIVWVNSKSPPPRSPIFMQVYFVV